MTTSERVIVALIALYIIVKFFGWGDFHRHKCARCGYLWAHFRSSIPTGQMNNAHTCPNCGGHQPKRYTGLQFPVGQPLFYGTTGQGRG